MTVVQSQSNIPARSANIAVGRYHTTATAAAFKITTGFQPRYVKVQNEGSFAQMEWYEGMTAAYSIKKMATGTASMPTSLGITVAADGFTVGLDTDVNIIDEQLAWIAIG
jgi:hypothetical protein